MNNTTNNIFYHPLTVGGTFFLFPAQTLTFSLDRKPETKKTMTKYPQIKVTYQKKGA